MTADHRRRNWLDPAVIAQLSSLPIVARGTMLGSVSGRHSSPHHGSSVEFAEYRKYVPGDDLRRLDWRAYGRSDRFYVKEFEADTNLRLILVLDTSRSMGVQTGGTTKLDYARRLAGTLSYLGIQQGDAVGLTCIADRVVQHIPSRRNPAHLSTLLDQLERTEPLSTTELPPLLHELAETIRQRAMVILLSDLLVEPAELQACFEHMRFRKHDLSVFHLMSEEELNFTLQRPTRFLDPEGGPSIFANPVEIADRYRQAITEYLNAMRRICLETAVDYRLVLLEESYEKVLRNFLMGRHHVRRSR